MITKQNISDLLDLLVTAYGEKAYPTDNPEKMKSVFNLWATMFAEDDPVDVAIAVKDCIATMEYPPRIANIRKRIAGRKMQGQMTAVEAFQEISKAVNECYDRESSTKAFNNLPPICRKLVGFPAQLVSWSRVSEESFQTVIMSAIREGYRDLAKQEFDYHAMPKQLQDISKWMVEAPKEEALPEPKKNKSIDEVIEEANHEAAKHSQIEVTPELVAKHASKVAEFLKPLTKEDIERVKQREYGRFFSNEK